MLTCKNIGMAGGTVIVIRSRNFIITWVVSIPEYLMESNRDFSVIRKPIIASTPKTAINLSASF